MPEFLLGSLYETFLCVRFTILSFFFFVTARLNGNRKGSKGFAASFSPPFQDTSKFFSLPYLYFGSPLLFDLISMISPQSVFFPPCHHLDSVFFSLREHLGI